MSRETKGLELWEGELWIICRDGEGAEPRPFAIGTSEEDVEHIARLVLADPSDDYPPDQVDLENTCTFHARVRLAIHNDFEHYQEAPPEESLSASPEEREEILRVLRDARADLARLREENEYLKRTLATLAGVSGARKA